jgi:hypothetical protein
MYVFVPLMGYGNRTGAPSGANKVKNIQGIADQHDTLGVSLCPILVMACTEMGGLQNVNR